MSELKCPFCQQEVEKVEWQDGDIEICCSNCDITGSAKLWQELIRTRKALEFITRISGAGMSYQDMVIDAHEVAKFALGQVKYPILIGRYDKEMADLLKGGDNG